jgi:hypothetical protein
MPGVERERIWAWLCRPGIWPTWYRNSSNVHVENQTQPNLRLGPESRCEDLRRDHQLQ